MKLSKNCAVRTSTGEIVLENYSFTDEMRHYVRVNPLADFVIKLRKGGAVQWVTETEYNEEKVND